MTRMAVITAFVLSLAGCATTESQIQESKKLTKEHFVETATVKDDSLDTIATISTMNGFQTTDGFMFWEDSFLRAFIDKKTGATTYQLYHLSRYRDDGWRNYNGVNYDVLGGVQSASLTLIGNHVDCSGSQCTFEEHVGFDVDESLLRDLAGVYNPLAPAVWRFKFTSKSGAELVDKIYAAEIAGLIEKVDAYRASKGFAKHSPSH